MQQDDQRMGTLLHNRECPVGFQCLAVDCIECMKIHEERGEHHGQSQNAGLQQTLHPERPSGSEAAELLNW